MIKPLFHLPVIFSFLLMSSAQAQPRQGQLAEEIALPGVNGDTIRLSSLKGKVVLLDFWASWCSPCRSSNKQLTKLYPKYKEKGFEILGISLQVIDAGGWETPTALKWGIYALPTSFLVDKDGKLLAMDLEGKDLEKALKYLLEK
jgi:peroxiredoxin